MTDGTDPLLQDWITIWHSELAALAADREVQEHWQRLAARWAAQCRAAVQTQGDGPPRPAGPDAPPRAAAVAAPSDAAELDQLRTRIAELERQLAGLGRG